MNTRLLIISLIPLVFGALGLLYSFFGIFEQGGNNSSVQYQPFQGLTIQEIGGHFLFGYIVALPSRSITVGILAGLMALTMDFDHILYVAGFDIPGRLDHSVPFAILSSILMGLFTYRFLNKLSLGNYVLSSLPGYCKKVQDGNSLNAVLTDKIFSQFIVLTFAAFLSHIAYDVFVDGQASFPLFAPFSFDEFIIPTVYALPLEAVAVLFSYLYYIIYYKHLPKLRLELIHTYWKSLRKPN